MKLDWRVWLGVVATAVYLLLAFAYVLHQGMGALLALPAENLGSFLEGAFAPLAFLWLVIGYFLQRSELKETTAALHAQHEEFKRSTEQAVIQSESMKASEVHARQEAYLQLAQQIRAQLGTITGLLYISSQSTEGGGQVSRERHSQLFAELSVSDTEAFSRQIIQFYLATQDKQERYDFFYGTAIRARHSNHFAKTFEDLLRRAENADAEGVFRNALLYSAHGIVYQRIQDYRKLAPPELASPKATGTWFDVRNTQDLDGAEAPSTVGEKRAAPPPAQGAPAPGKAQG